MLKQFRIITAALAVVLSLSVVAFGQGTYGSIQGTVTDSNGAVVPGATVEVVSTGSTTGFKRTFTTNEEGRFRVARIAPGTYNLTFESSGFVKVTREVSVFVDRTASADISLKAAGGTTTVDVIADSAVTVDLTDTKIDTNINKEVIDALPKGNNFTNLLKIAPNVRPEAAAGGFQIDGASGSENVFVIDGQEVTNFATGEIDQNNNLPFELLQEVQIKSTGFEAEYGGATGGVINAVTAGGNNEWRGVFGVTFRPSQFLGRPNRVLNSYGFNDGEFDYFQPIKDGGVDFFPVARLSGPIIKDKVWGAITYAPQYFEAERTNQYFTTDAPTRQVNSASVFNASTTREYAQARVDAQPFSSLRVFGTFLWNPVIDEGELPSLAEGLTNPNGPPVSPADQAIRGGRDNSNSYNFQATYTPLDWFLFNVRHGRSFLNEKRFSYGRVAGQRYAISTSSPLNPCTNDINFPGDTNFCRGFNTGSNSLTFLDVSTRETYDFDASFVGLQAGGLHNFKVGYQQNSLFNDVDSGYTNTGYTLLYFGRPVDVWNGNLTPLPECPNLQNLDTTLSNCQVGSARLVRIGTLGQASSDNYAFFVQDSWSPTDRLTLNLGLRLENEVVPSFGDPATTRDIEFGWGDKLAPRLGVAFDLTGDGKTKVFGSYGWFYDRFKYELPRGLFGAETFLDDFGEIIPSRGLSPFDYTFAAMLAGRPDTPGGSCPIAMPVGWSLCSIDRRVPSNDRNADPFAGAGAVDPNLEAMRQSEFTFGFEREVGANYVLSARYTHKQLDQAIEDIGAFNDQGSEAYVIGNPGQGLACEISTLSQLPCTEAERKYDAVEVRLDKRASKYFYNVNYTWSRLFGNYSGLASSDEFGRNSPNVNRFFDLPMLGWDADGNPDNGLLATDRTHVFKAYAGYNYDWGGNSQHKTGFSGFTTIQSGTPVTTVYDLYNVTTSILNGRGDLGRTEAFTETDFSVKHTYNFGRDSKWSVEGFMEIRNLFNERNTIRRFGAISSSNITSTQLTAAGCTTCTDEVATFQTIFNGGIRQFVLNHLNSGNAALTNPEYNQPQAFQAGRDVRFGFRVKF